MVAFILETDHQTNLGKERGPVRGGGTHVPCLKFATSHVGISQDSYVACRNFVSEELCREI